MRSGSARKPTEPLQEKVQAVSKEVDVRKLEWASGRNECSTEEGEMRSRLGACFKKMDASAVAKKTGFLRQGPKAAVYRNRRSRWRV